MRLLALLSALVLLPVMAFASIPSLDQITADRTLGKTDAPVTMIEYASLTCSHCAEFATKTLPELEKQAVDAGKLKIIYRDFPLDGTALKAAALARCLPKEQYFPFIKLVFAKQSTWATAADPIAALMPLASLAGLDPETAKACTTDTKILDALAAKRLEAEQKYKVAATPTFVFNDGADKIEGAAQLAQFMTKIDALVEAKPTAKPSVSKPAAPVKK